MLRLGRIIVPLIALAACLSNDARLAPSADLISVSVVNVYEQTDDVELGIGIDGGAGVDRKVKVEGKIAAGVKRGSSGAFKQTLMPRHLVDKIFSNPAAWIVVLNGDGSVRIESRAPSSSKSEGASTALPTLELKVNKLVVASGKEVMVRDVKLAADGTMSAIFSIGNDELIHGFKAAVGLEIQDQSGGLLSYIPCGELEIGGKPPGRAVWGDKPWSGALPAIARNHANVGVVLKATRL